MPIWSGAGPRCGRLLTTRLANEVSAGLRAKPVVSIQYFHSAGRWRVEHSGSSHSAQDINGARSNRRLEASAAKRPVKFPRAASSQHEFGPTSQRSDRQTRPISARRLVVSQRPVALSRSQPATTEPSRLQPAPSSLATNYVRTLQSITEPVLIYQAPSRTVFSIVCFSSTAFCAVLASFNYTQYASVQNTTFLAAGICVSAMWVALGLYFANGPLHYIRSISALPATPEMRHAKGTAAVLLDFELDSLFFFTKPRHSIATADKVTRDLSLAAGTQSILAREQMEKLRFKWGAGFFRGIRTTMVAFIKMFTRRDTAYIALPGGTHWKVDLPGIRNMGRGGALEQLLRLDVSKRRGLRKLFGPDEKPSL